MKYLREEGMRAINPAFAKEFIARRERESTVQDYEHIPDGSRAAHPWRGRSVTAYQAALKGIGIKSGAALARFFVEHEVCSSMSGKAGSEKFKDPGKLSGAEASCLQDCFWDVVAPILDGSIEEVQTKPSELDDDQQQGIWDVHDFALHHDIYSGNYEEQAHTELLQRWLAESILNLDLPSQAVLIGVTKALLAKQGGKRAAWLADGIYIDLDKLDTEDTRKYGVGLCTHVERSLVKLISPIGAYLERQNPLIGLDVLSEYTGYPQRRYYEE